MDPRARRIWWAGVVWLAVFDGAGLTLLGLRPGNLIGPVLVFVGAVGTLLAILALQRANRVPRSAA